MEPSKHNPIPPELKVAAGEIEAILKKHNLAGIAVIHAPEEKGPGFLDYVCELGPTYSCIEVGRDQKLEIRKLPQAPIILPERHNWVKKEEFERMGKKMVGDTLNMLFNLRAKLGQVAMVVLQTEQVLRTRFKVEPPPDPKQNGKPGGLIQ